MTGWYHWLIMESNGKSHNYNWFKWYR